MAALWVFEHRVGLVRVALVVEHLRRVALADNVKWLFNILEDNLTTLLEAGHLDLDDLADASLVVPEVLDAFIVFNDARDSEIETAENNSLLNILNESQDVDSIHYSRHCQSIS